MNTTMNLISRSRYVVATLLACTTMILVAAEPAAEPHPEWVNLKLRNQPPVDGGHIRLEIDKGNCDVAYSVTEIQQIPLLQLSTLSYNYFVSEKTTAILTARPPLTKPLLQAKQGVHFPLGYHIYKVVKLGDKTAECVISELDPLGKPQKEYTVLYWPYEFNIFYLTNQDNKFENIEWKGEAGDAKNPVIKGEYSTDVNMDQKVTREVELKVGSLVGENFIITKIVRPDAEKKIVGWLELQFIGAKERVKGNPEKK